jgi:hypothetical protein
MSGLFVEDNETFDVEVEYYEVDGNLIVKDVDDSYDSKNKSEKVKFTFRIPNQGDCVSMNPHLIGLFNESGEMQVSELNRLEYVRFLNLLTSWSVDKEVSSKNVEKLNTKIYRAAVNGVREKIQLQGII